MSEKITRRTLVGFTIAAGATTWMAAPLRAQDRITILTFGGALAEAQRKTYFEPFTKATGIQVLEDEWAGEMAKLRAMVQSGNVTWDVIDLSGGQTDRACDEGLVEPLDINQFGGADKFVPNTVHACGIPTLVASIVIGYNASKFPNGAPKTLADFWDAHKFPGPRALKKWPKHNLEFALAADNVPPGEVYKLLETKEGVDRAFRKLDQIKPHVKVWFDTWAQPQQLLIDGEVVMSTGTNGRLAVAAASHPEINWIWDHQGYDLDFWGVVKGGKNRANAVKFIEFASRPEIMAEFPKHIQYGPTVKAAIDKMSPEMAKKMPTNPANMQGAWKVSGRYWGDHQDDLEVRFQAWLNK
ncbi:MAG: ABC transporter substrate-binding protein [Alphaproteobacteria bacterium]|nr:ABC transporter substrate-binding protein [Alphaproteobacteria bacterium]